MAPVQYSRYLSCSLLLLLIPFRYHESKYVSKYPGRYLPMYMTLLVSPTSHKPTADAYRHRIVALSAVYHASCILA
ncbi:hypothetical protein F4859DRAFT_470164 [Xylaria cf. heliscus]|nr:hypothetical protein F4859DRAFT_470164 [Xylaria cf. heliscus]